MKMGNNVIQSLELLIQLIEIVGASILVIGFFFASFKCCLEIFHRNDFQLAVSAYRQALGRVILIGLELLVAATIMKTIAIEPSLASLGVLLAMVVIRTMIGWTTVLEMNGRWPWQKTK